MVVAWFIVGKWGKLEIDCIILSIFSYTSSWDTAAMATVKDSNSNCGRWRLVATVTEAVTHHSGDGDYSGVGNIW